MENLGDTDTIDLRKIMGSDLETESDKKKRAIGVIKKPCAIGSQTKKLCAKKTKKPCAIGESEKKPCAISNWGRRTNFFGRQEKTVRKKECAISNWGRCT